MKLVAVKGFANVKKLGIKLEDIKDDSGKVVLLNAFKKDADGNPQSNYIHKGARFSIGDTEEFKALQPDDQEKILFLVSSGCVCYAKDTPVVTRIDREVVQEGKRSAKLAAEAAENPMSDAVASAVAAAVKPLSDTVAALTSAIAELKAAKK